MNHISEYEDKALEKLKAAWLEAKDDERVLILAFAQGIVAGAKSIKSAPAEQKEERAHE